jgi:flagellar biosynthesis GTPase FlhF
MDENVKVIFEGIKNALGESSSVITDRTIEQTINEFSAFAPQENAEKFWNESVVNHLKNTVAGQVRAFASDKRKEWDTIKEQEISNLKKEWEKSHSAPQPTPAPQPQPQPTPTPAPEPKPFELPDDVKAKLEEFEKFKKDFEAKEQEEKQKQIVTEKRKKLSDLIKRPEAGMPNELLRNIIFENIQISPEEEDTSILLKIQGKYNETCTKYTKDGINPFISDKGGSSDVKSFIDRKREEDKANKENNIVSRYYSKINK